MKKIYWKISEDYNANYSIKKKWNELTILQKFMFVVFGAMY